MDEGKRESSREERIRCVREVVENGCTKAAILRGCVKLSCCRKTLMKDIREYKAGGKDLFVHGNTGRPPATTYPAELKKKIVALYLSGYTDCSFTQFAEVVLEDFGVRISDMTLHRWLKEELVVSPLSKKRTKKACKLLIRERMRKPDLTREESEAVAGVSYILDDEFAHPTRPRSKYFGEMVQMDASEYRWVEGCPKWHLHAAIDDATGELVGAWFDQQETLCGYYHVLEMILLRYGIPAKFYTDRRTVFEYERKGKKDEEKDTFTQFSACCRELGIDILVTSVSQAKGRVEKLNQTLQHRLPVELRRHGVDSMDKANAFLRDTYIGKFNERFSLLVPEDKASSVFQECPSAEKINQTLAVVSGRSVDQGNCIRYDRRRFFPYDKDGKRASVRPGTRALVIKAFDGSLFLNANDVIYALEETLERETHSLDFDQEKPKAALSERKRHIPPLTHPWKMSFHEQARKGKGDDYVE